MVCADQYVVCNPSTSSCTSPAGIISLTNDMSLNTLNLNEAQLATAARITQSLLHSATFDTVSALGAAALWANNIVVTGHISYGLPENQWQTEVLGWFQTNLAKFQASMVEFAFKTADLGPYGSVQSPVSRAQQAQCTSQLVRTVGDVQNFSVCGVLVVVCVSAALVLLDCSLEPIVDFINSFCGRDSVARRARQADNKLHLLRMAVTEGVDDENEWELGKLDVPVRDAAAQFSRPTISKELVSYRESNSEKDTKAVQAQIVEEGREGEDREGKQPVVSEERLPGWPGETVAAELGDEGSPLNVRY
jgi:hypothetical protein